LGSRACAYHRKKERATTAKEALNDRIQSTENNKREQHNNRDEGAHTTHQKQQRQPNNDQKGLSDNHPIQNRLLQMKTRSDHEP
jgi:hypothetical protein